MDALLIGYARVSTEERDLTAQRNPLDALGVSPERPGLRQALAACRADDTLVVTKLDRLALAASHLGPDDTDTLASRRNLALACRDAGHPAQAIALFEPPWSTAGGCWAPTTPTPLPAATTSPLPIGTRGTWAGQQTVSQGEPLADGRPKGTSTQRHELTVP